MPFVLDNSVVSGWYLPEQSNAYTEAVAELLKSDRALVPPLWQQELANVLKTACSRGKLAPAAARQIIDTLGDLPIDVDTGPAPGQRQLFELALRYQLSSYDAVYLELALRHGLKVATQDAQLKAAAIEAGLGVV